MTVKLLFSKIKEYPILVFGLVGVVGFTVDAMLLKLFITLVNDNPVIGRTVSFPLAVTTTWLLNRNYTFQSIQQAWYKEWLTYVAVNSIGLVVNLFVFMSVIIIYTKAEFYPISVLALASIIAMFFNYFGSKYLVFGNNWIKR